MEWKADSVVSDNVTERKGGFYSGDTHHRVVLQEQRQEWGMTVFKIYLLGGKFGHV